MNRKISLFCNYFRTQSWWQPFKFFLLITIFGIVFSTMCRASDFGVDPVGYLKKWFVGTAVVGCFLLLFSFLAKE